MGEYEVVRINGKLTIRKSKQSKKEYERQYRIDHAEEIKANNKAWYERHKEEKKAKSKAYYHENTEKVKAYQQKYREEHKAERNEYQRDYQIKYYWRRKSEQLRENTVHEP